jgi:ABC-type uncharacterized transport system permease subunit
LQLGPFQNIVLHLGVFACLLAGVWAAGRLAGGKLFRAGWAAAILALGSLLLVPFLIAGPLALGAKVFTDLFYTLILLLFAVGIVTTILCGRHRTEVPIIFVSPLVLVVALGAAFTALPRGEEAPALDWWMGLTHGMGIFLGYACFAAAFAAGATYLLQEASLRGVQFPRLIWKLPSLESSERMGIASVAAGLALLTLAMGVGLVWIGKERGALGEAWHKDPTVLFGAVTWLLYAAILVTRATRLLRGRRVAVSYVAAFFLVIFTFLGTSFVFHGGHRSIRSVEGKDHHSLGLRGGER